MKSALAIFICMLFLLPKLSKTFITDDSDKYDDDLQYSKDSKNFGNSDYNDVEDYDYSDDSDENEEKVSMKDFKAMIREFKTMFKNQQKAARRYRSRQQIRATNQSNKNSKNYLNIINIC